ncbi:MAG TPA: PKD domain-containing protein [Vicinamibacterales bacterium]|nr:PKD domain-containing protein [Vicinamibacterales bacterium]
MRRTAIVGFLFALIVLGSRPDAAFVPNPRTPDSAAAARRAEAARIRSQAPSMPRMVVPRPPAARAMAMAAPAAPMQAPVGRGATATALSVTPNPAGVAAPVTLTAAVSVVPPASGTPTGLVRFRSNGVVIGSAPLAPSGLAVFSTGLVTPGATSLSASYAGDTSFAPSTSDPVPHVTNTAAASTITAILTSPSSSAAGAPVTVVAIVIPLGAGAPTGLVEFRDGGTPIGTSALATFSGLQVAFTSITPGTAGPRTLTAHYNGDATFAGSVSPPAIHTVYNGAAPSATTTTLAASPTSSLVGAPVTLTATVARAAGGTATGTVDFYAHGALLGSQALAASAGGAQATLTVSNLPKGMALLTAAYRGNATSASSATLIPLFQCVDCAAANATPLAEAGQVQVVTPGATVQLDGTASADLEGAPLTYTWTNVATAPFTPATLSNTNSARPTFVAAVPEAIYAFDLVVSDGSLSSPADRVYVLSTATYVNAAPIAQAGPDQFLTAQQPVTLSGTGSFDPDGLPAPLTYRWIRRSAPAGTTAELSNPTSATPSFYLDLEGRYEFELVVFDGATLSAADRVVVATNHQPVARAGEDQERTVGSTAQLSGAGSTDEDGQRLTYQWTLVSLPAGSNAALTSTTAVRPSLSLDLPGNYVVRLIVHDGIDPSEPDTMTISTGDLPPVADPGPARGVPGGTPTSGALADDRPVITAGVGQTVHLDGTASFDPNFQLDAALTYQWTLVSRPAGSAAALAAPTSTRPTFVADAAGDYVVRLVVTSGALSSAPREIRITTGNSRPVADAGPAQTVAAGSTVTLDATRSSDVNGDPLSYRWTFVTTPAGSAAAISGDSLPRASFIADVPGVYVAQVLVSDGGFLDPATVLITTANVAPIGRAGADQAVPNPSAVSLDANASTDANFDPLTFRWLLTRKPAGSAAVLSGAATALPSFSVDVAGDYVAQLRVADADRYGDVDTMLVTTGNAAPVANAGGDRNVAAGGLVSLDGTNSSDANGAPLAYAWSILYRPSGSTATLSNPADAEPGFVADLPGTYVVQLITSDGTLRSAPDTAVVTTVAPPVAVAVAPAAAYTGTSVPLDGSASSDPQLLPLTYLWSFGSRPAGSVASIENPLAPITAFTADLAGTYVVCLVVSNGAVASAADCETVAVTAAPALTLSPSVVSLALNESASMTVTLNQPAGPSGLEVSLVANGEIPVVVPTSVTVLAGQTSAAFNVTSGASDGTVTITATAPGFAGDLAHVNVSVSGITITLGAGLVVAPQQIRDLSLTLSEPAPPGGVLITLTSSNPAVATVTPSIFVPEGADVPMTNPQVVGLAYGMTEITASATDFAGDAEVVAVARSIYLSPSTSNVVVGGTGNLLLQASAPAPAGGLGFNVNVDTGGVLALPSVVTIPENQLTAPIAVTGQTLGSTVVTVTPADASDTSSASAAVNVTPAQPINLQSVAVGFQLQTWVSGSLGAPAPAGGRTVTITSGNTNLVWLATADGSANAASIQLFVPAGTTQIPSFLVRGDDESGSVVLTASSPGLPDGTSTVTLAPSGLVFGTGNFVTGLFSPNTVVTVHHARLDPVSLIPIERQLLAGGIKVAGLAIQNSNPAVGVLGTPSFDFAQRFWSVSFDALAAGTTQLSLPQDPAPATGTQITITVAAPMTFSAPTLTVGRNLQAPASVNLGSPAPAGNLPVTITSADPSKVLLSKTAAGAGSASISLIVPAGSTNTPQFFVQALDESGTVAVNAAAANFEPGSLAVTLAPSGVVFVTQSFTTHPASPNTTLTLGTAYLEPGTLEYVPGAFGCDRCQAVRGGLASFQVTVVSSDNPIGSVPNPATFNAGSATATTEFDPHATGSVTLSVVTPVAPAGFSTPANGAAIQASITPATATLAASALLIGKNLQSSNAVSLGEPAPAGNLLVTIQSSDPSKVLLSTTPTSPAMDTITVTAPAGQSSAPPFYVHGLAETGTVTVNLTAPGYVSGSFDVTLKPSGFIFRTGSFSTSTLSPDTPLEIRAVWLDEGTLEYPADPFCTRCQALATGVTAEVSVTSLPTTVGTITTSPVTIAPATGTGTTAFHPLSGGTATLSLGTPSGFFTPSTFREITASVGNPPLSIADMTVGKDLQAVSVVNLGAPAEAGGAAITVSTLDPNVLLSTTPTAAGSSSIVLNAAAGATQSPAFYVHALTASGAAQIGATASGFSPASATVSFRPSGIVFVSSDFVTGALSPNTAVTVRSVWLDALSLTWTPDPQCSACQAVRGGIAALPVTITSSDPSVGTVTGAIFSGGDATATAVFDPQANGTTSLSIVAPDGFSASGNYSSIVATVQPALNLGSAIVGRDLQAAAGGFVTVPAPVGNLLVTLQSSDPSKLLLATSPTAAGQPSIVVSIPAGSGSFGYFVQALTGTGSAQVLASAPGHSDGQAVMTFAPSGFALEAADFTIAPDAPNASLLIRSVRLDPDFFNYITDPSCSACQAVRPGIDVTVDVTSSNPAVGSIVGTAQFTAGVGSQAVQFDPHTVGTTTVALATPPPAPFSTPSNLQSIEVTVAVPPPSITVQAVTLGKNLQTSLSGSLGAPAPAGNLEVTITSADPDKVLLAASPTTVGASSIIVTVPAGSSTLPAFYAQALSDTGTVQLTASAAGFMTGNSLVTLWPSGFVILTSDFTTSPTAVPTEIQVRPVRIDPTFHNFSWDQSCSSCQNLRAGFTADVPVASADDGVGTITVSPLSFTGNDGVKSTGFDGVAAGTVAISLSAVAGFETPSNLQSIQATVTNSYVAFAGVTGAPTALLGKNLQTPVTGSLGQPAPAGNLEITIASADPSKVLLSASPNLPGAGSVIVSVPAGSSTVPTIYAQGLDAAGTVALTATAPGYVGNPFTLTLAPSGFAFMTIGVTGNDTQDFTTTSSSADTLLAIQPVRLEPGTLNLPPWAFSLCYNICQQVRPGITASVAVTSSNTAVGTITNSPLTFDHTVASGLSAVFDPASAGATTLTVVAPAGFSQPSSQASLVATVTPPPLTISPRTIGQNLQVPVSVNLGAPAPAGNLDVTISSADPSKVLLSASGGAGSPSITVTVPAGQTSSASFYVQALAYTGAFDITASAPGYGSGTAAMTLTPSGFVIAHIYWCLWCGSQEIQTTAGASNTGFYLASMRLDPATGNPIEAQNVRGGLTVDVTVSTTPTGVGTIVPTPVTVTGGTAFSAGVVGIEFDPAAAGTTLIEVVTPPGFSASNGNRTMQATVTNAALSLSAQSIGKNLQVPVTVSLGEPAPAGGLDVTIGSADASKLIVSADPAAQGAVSALVHADAGQTSVTVYAQALSDAGSVVLTATAPGRTSGTGTMTLAPAGFIITHQYWCVSCVPQTFSTTTGAANTQLYVVAGRLNAGTGNFEVSQNVRGGLSVDVTVSSTSNAIAVVPPTVTFTGGIAFGSSVASIQADPMNGGTAVLEVVTPDGFAASNDLRQMTATVAGPALSVGDTAIGKDLQSAVNVGLQEPAPAGGVDVTLESADASKVLISGAGTTAGAASASVHVPAGSSTATFYVQALASSGTVALTASAAGFTAGGGSVTLQPSGFVIAQMSWCIPCFGVTFNTTTGSPNTPLDVVSARLLPGTLAFDTLQPVRGGLTVNVDVQSSATNVGTLTPATVTFTGGVSVAATAFDPANPGVAVIEPVPPSGFSSPSTFRQLTANVAAPGIVLAVNTVGKDLQTSASGTLGAPAPEGGDLLVTIASADPARLRVAALPTDVGGPSIVLPVPAGTQNLPTFYVQALDEAGSVDVTASATGYTQGTAPVPLARSGFVSLTPGGNFTTTTLASPTTIAIYSAALNPALQYLSAQPVRPGVTVQVAVTAEDSTGSGVGTIVGSPVTFTGNQGVQPVSFDPAAVGSSIVTVVPPAGFSPPSNFTVFTATVNAPAMFVGDALLGKDLQTAMAGSLAETSPADVTFTITSSDPSKVLLSALPTAAGSAAIGITATGPTSVIPAFFVQGLADSGTVTLNVTAPGFAPATAQVTLTPSGFLISSPADFTTQGNAPGTELQIASARLAPGTLAYQVGQPLRPGAAASVNVTSSAPAVGTITLSPVTFSGNQGVRSTFFDPQPVASDGTATVQISTPPGFSTPSQYQSVQVTVQAVPIDSNATSSYAQWLLGAPAAPNVANFDSFAAGTILTGNEYASIGLTIVQRDGQPMLVQTPSSPYLEPNLNSQPNGLTSSGIPAYLGDNSENYDFVFSHAVLSAGLWIGNLDLGAPAVVVQFLDSANDVIQSYAATASDANLIQGPGGVYDNRLFVGVNATVPIARIRVFNPSGDGDGLVFDDITFSGTFSTLALTPGSSSVAVGATSPLEVSIAQALPSDLTVALVSSDPASASVPASVVIPAGATSASFAVTGTAAGGALVTASAPGAAPAKAVIAVGGNVVEWISNTSGVWSQGANWSTGAPPGPADVVRIDRPGSITVFVDTVAAVRALFASDAVTVASAFSVANAAAFDGGLNLQAALQGAGRASVRGMSTWASGTVALAGGLDVEAGQTLSITLANEHRVQGSALRNRGTVVFAAGTVTATLNGTILNDAGGLWVVQGDRQIGSDFNGGTNTFTNAGTLRRTSGIGTLTLGGGLITFINTGTIEIQTGTVNAAVSTLSSGHLSVSAGAEIPLSNFTLQPGSTFSGAGVLKLNGNTTVTGNLTVPVAVEMTGNVGGSGAISMTAPMTWISGVMSVAGGLDIEAGRTLTISGANEHRLLSSALRNRGTVVFSGGTVTATVNGSVLNDAGALWLIQGDRQIASDFSGGTNTFTNAGTLRRTSGIGTLTFGGGLITFANTGTIEIQSGTVNAAVPMNTSGHLSVSAGAEIPLSNFTLQAGSTFSGAGMLKLNGNTTVTGKLTVPVAVEMTGNVGGSGGLGMTAPMTWISGVLSLAGGLDIEAGQTLNIQGANEHRVLSSALRNRGTVVFSGGTVTATVNGTVLNDAGALWEVQGDRQIASDFSGGTNTFTNAGTLRRTSGIGTLTFGGGLITFINTGTMEIQTGTVNAAVAFNTSGHVSVSPGAEIPLSNFTLQAGSTFGGAGMLKFNGTTTVTADLTVPVALEMTGNVGGTGRITMTAPMWWISGTMSLEGGLDIEAGQTLSVQGANDHRVYSSTLRNRGTVMFGGGTMSAILNGTILNETGGIFDALGTRQIASDFSGGTNTFLNAGLLRNSGPFGTLTIGGGQIGFVNSGTISQRIAGTGASDHDFINVTGQMTFGGTYAVFLVAGFTPAVNDVFTMFTYGSRTGTFSVVNGNGHAWVPCYGAASLLLGDPANAGFCAGP